MAALTADRRQYVEREGRYIHHAVDADAQIFAGALVAQLSSGEGFIRPATENASLVVVGVAQESADNRNGAAESMSVKVRKGVFRLENNGDVTRKHVGRSAYVVDDQTVSASDAGATRPQAGTIVLVDEHGVWVDVGVLSAHDETRPQFGMRTLELTHADLTLEAKTQVLAIGAALPAGARVIGRELRLTTPFSGPGASSVTADVGSSADADAIVVAANIFTGAPGAQAGTAGINPTGSYGAVALQATITSNVNLDLLSAGALVIDVLFVVA